MIDSMHTLSLSFLPRMHVGCEVRDSQYGGVSITKNSKGWPLSDGLTPANPKPCHVIPGQHTACRRRAANHGLPYSRASPWCVAITCLRYTRGANGDFEIAARVLFGTLIPLCLCLYLTQ